MSAMRVVSLLPSATELLAAVGGIDLLVGRSHECDFPAGLDDVPMLTAQKTDPCATSAEIDTQVRSVMQTASDTQGDQQQPSLYTLDVDLLRDLKPDVILTQDLCDVCSIDLNTVRGVAAQLSPAPAVVSLNPTSVFDVFDDLLHVGDAIGRHDEAQVAMVDLRGRYWEAVDYVNPYLDGPEVVFIEWMDPLLVGGHWTPELIAAAGGRHSINKAGERSRQVNPEDVLEVMPDRLIICPCGYDLDAIDRELATLTESKWWGLLPAVQDGCVALIDGSAMFNRPGPRLVDAMCWLVGWFNDRPEIQPCDFPVRLLAE